MPDEGMIQARTRSPYEGKTLVDNLRDLGISDHEIARHLRDLHDTADKMKAKLGEPLHETMKNTADTAGNIAEGAKAIQESGKSPTSGFKNSAEMFKQLEKEGN